MINEIVAIPTFPVTDPHLACHMCCLKCLL
jgi:hypothetical protein